MPEGALERRSKRGTILDQLDEAVLGALPKGSKVLSITPSGASAWAQTVRIDVEHQDGPVKAYFMKTEHGEGPQMMQGAYEAEKTLNQFLPAHVPKPLSWGSYQGDPDVWFLLSEFREMVEELPEAKDFVRVIAKLHKDSAGKSPEGKYGFQVPTHLAFVANDNTWQESWEGWFSSAMVRMFEVEERSHGNDDTQAELEALKADLFAKVIPRLLRPLESNGRKVVPCLIHANLWPGNIMVDANNDDIVIYDSCAFWGHNEADLGTWRAPRYRLGQPYLREYQRQMGQSAPVEDWDDRNSLYAMRYDYLLSALFPKETKFREAAMDEMRRLIAKYPGGFEDYSEEPHSARRESHGV